MHICVEGNGNVRLDEPTDFHSFDLRVEGGARSIALEALGTDASAAPEDDHVFVSVERVRSLAETAIDGGVDADWEQSYQGMLGYAGSKGWMNDDASFIKAHLVAHG